MGNSRQYPIEVAGRFREGKGEYLDEGIQPIPSEPLND